MRLLILGCSGFIGSHIIDKIDGYDITGIDVEKDWAGYGLEKVLHAF